MGPQRPWWNRHRILLIVLTLVLVLLLSLLLAILRFGPAAVSAYFLSPRLNQDLDNLQKVFTVLALIVGGIWTYFNFFKGRTYTPRLEPKVSGTVAQLDGTTYLVATSHLKNVGLSQLDIVQEGTALIVYGYKPGANASRTTTPESDQLGIFAVFGDHFWIEPGETIEEQRFIVVPETGYIAFRLELRIISQKIQWKAKTIVSHRFEKPSNKEDADGVVEPRVARWARRPRRNQKDRARKTNVRRV